MKQAAMTSLILDSLPALAHHQADYWIDAWQRNILFWDVMRERSDQFYQQQAKTAPNVLRFEGEILADGRTLPHPVNYGLVRIIPPEGVTVDPQKRPFVVIDPRAGHGPGIGGFKADSEIGAALSAGHPTYFVGFTPEPLPGQTIEDVMHAEAVFLEKVIARHPEAQGKPCVIGNCQAGWAVMMLAATRPELCGPIIIPGAPLSYWAGIEGENPMRYSGGLLGGSWLTMLTSDLDNGKFDGSWLVSNFENLNPSNTLWTKYYNLWSKVDTEAPRFLDFEKWWGNHVRLNGEEIQWIVDQLFIGNQLATGEIIASDGIRIDLRNIRSPILCFCSKGDNITPPQQALGWITDLYEHDDAIRANGQTIIYSVHDKIGHLGIFVSGSVARKEHTEFASNIDLIDVLPPGLYEAIMTPKTDQAANPDLAPGDWILRFEPRTLDDIRAIVQPDPENERRFATVRRISEINLGLYRTFLQPFVQAISNEHLARWERYIEPSTLPFELFSDRNPLMIPLAGIAEAIRKQRHPVSPDNPMRILQEACSSAIITLLDIWRDLRDSSVERTFLAVYGSPVIQALVGLKASDTPPRRHPGIEPEHLDFIREQMAAIKAGIDKGDTVTAAIRTLVYIGMSSGSVDERAFNALRNIRAEYADISLETFKKIVREQYFCLLIDTEAALAAIPAMLPAKAAERNKLLAQINKVVSAIGKPEGERAKRLKKIETLFSSKNQQPASR